MKVRVEDSCTGCRLCVESCPDVFQMGENDIAEVISPQVPPEFEEIVQQAAEECPVEAIIVG